MTRILRGRARRALPLAVLALAVPVAQSLPAAAATTSTTTTTVAAATTVPAPALPFTPPAKSTLRASSKKVFAHYMPNLPISLDNQAPATDYYARNYLNPTGEGGAHAAYGGFLRDRPQTRPQVADTAWRLRDLETEVRQAATAGVDGFSVDLLQLGDTGGQLWTNTKLLMQAASTVDPGFKIMLMPDMSSSVGGKDAATLAKSLAELAKSPSAYKLADGRLVVSPFMAEKKTVAWWTTFLNTMKTTYATPVAFWPLFVGNEQTYASSFAPISYGMSIWGSRNPLWNNPLTTASTGPVGRADNIQALGKKFMQPVSLQDERPRSSIYDEAENTTNLRNTWQIAMKSGAEHVQLTTWNDYVEGSQFAPSAKHGWSYLDINAYYLAWYKTGTAPTITRDAAYVTHRTQPYAAKPSFAQTKLMAWRGGSPARDTVEALTFLTAPATVAVTVGTKTTTCNAPAGVATCVAPLAAGSVKVTVTRSGASVAAVTSPHKVTTTPYVQDLQYVAASSLRPAA
ncbi:MAG TPA: glycoside hydrolase family 71 protein [Actinomycetales bacterium]|nr:glycoside hydrolase family 71 protein [Actinomycetales bacterium]